MLQLLEDPAVSPDRPGVVDDVLESDNDTWTKSRVAGLSPASIGRMSSSELARAIREISVLRFCDEHRLRFQDRDTLERLVYLARHCCRNQGY